MDLGRERRPSQGKGQEQDHNDTLGNYSTPLEYASDSGNRRQNIGISTDTVPRNIQHKDDAEDSDSESGGVALAVDESEPDSLNIDKGASLVENSAPTMKPKRKKKKDRLAQVSQVNAEAVDRYFLGPYIGRVGPTAHDYPYL